VNATSQPQIVIAHPDSSASASYEIIDILGEGASGITYRASQIQTQQQVALKALSLARIDDWKSLELFEREARVLSAIDREGIPKYIDYFHADVDGDSPGETLCQRYFYIVQELAPGKTLQEWMRAGKRLTESEVTAIAIQILEHLIYLHRQQPPIVHRDLKPSNILRTEDGKVYLVDFGAVRQAYHDTFMRGSTVVGTFGYMAPEQFRGQAFPTTDLYGLGATILSLLTHRSPAEIPLDGLRLNFRDRIQVSPHFADWLERMLEPDVSKRFSSAIQALSTLKHPPKSPKFKLGFSKFERIALSGCGAMGFLLLFMVFDRYKFYCLNAIGFTSTEPLVAMSKHADLNTIRNYLDRGFNVNTVDRYHHNLIYYAIHHNEPKIIELAIERGADISDSFNLSDEDKKAIERAETYNSKRDKSLDLVERTQLLLQARRISSNRINNILKYAVIKNEIKITKHLLANGIKAHGWIDKTTLLHIATLHKDGEIVTALLDNGIDPNLPDQRNCTPLYTAILRSRIIEVPKLSPSIDTQDIDDTISEKAIKTLLSKGAKLDNSCYYNSYLRTPIEAANLINRPDIAILIRQESIDK
jgi:serine/threonine protein kinase